MFGAYSFRLGVVSISSSSLCACTTRRWWCERRKMEERVYRDKMVVRRRAREYAANPVLILYHMHAYSQAQTHMHVRHNSVAHKHTRSPVCAHIRTNTDMHAHAGLCVHTTVAHKHMDARTQCTQCTLACTLTHRRVHRTHTQPHTHTHTHTHTRRGGERGGGKGLVDVMMSPYLESCAILLLFFLTTTSEGCPNSLADGETSDSNTSSPAGPGNHLGSPTSTAILLSFISTPILALCVCVCVCVRVCVFIALLRSVTRYRLEEAR